MAINNIWVFAQTSNGALTSGSLELVTKARSLGGSVSVWVAGDGASVAGAAGEYGATKVYAVDYGPHLAGVAVAAAMKATIDGGDAPDLVMFPQTYEGRDVMSRLSVKVDRTVLTNNIDIAAAGDSVSVTTPIFGGNTLVTTTFTGSGPFLAAFRPKSFAPEASGGGAASVVAVSVPDLGAAGAAKVTATHVEETSGPKLDEADIVVSGGRGLGESAKYEMVETLAKLLKGAPGASRAIVDAGWVPYSYQVGQTGKVVKPSVYIAAGISGATQHMVGIADLGIVGDVHKVLPKLIEALQGR
jgi:electron transfer flavoprotein alpha subunit